MTVMVFRCLILIIVDSYDFFSPVHCYSCSFDWHNKSNTQNSVWVLFQTSQSLPKCSAQCPVFSMLFTVSGNVVKHDLVCEHTVHVSIYSVMYYHAISGVNVFLFWAQKKIHASCSIVIYFLIMVCVISLRVQTMWYL